MSDSPASTSSGMPELPVEFSLRFRIRHKIALCFCLLVALVLTAFWLTVRNQLALTLQQQADNLGGALAAQTADSVTELVLANDLLSLNVVLNQLVRSGQVSSVSVFNVDNQVIASAGTQAGRDETLISTVYTAPIALQDSIAGTVRLNLDTALLRASLGWMETAFLLILGLGTLFALAAALALGNHFTAPLLGLSGALAEREPEDIDADPARGDEIALLQHRCAQLLAERRGEDEQRLVAEGIGGADPLAPGTGARLQASVLALRVVNAGTATELLHPSTLARLLGEYSLYLQKAARLYGGVAHRLDGESAIVSFDSRFSADHAFNSVCCARLFLMLMRGLNQRHRAQGSPVLEFRLGVHSGNVYLAAAPGKTGFVMGKPLETAGRLADQAAAGRILISESTWSEAGGNERLSGGESLELAGEGEDSRLLAWVLKEGPDTYADLLERQARHLLPDDNAADAPPEGALGASHT